MKHSTFQLISTLIFLCALIHTFLTPYFYDFSQAFLKKKKSNSTHFRKYYFLSVVFYLLSEVEIVFGVWLIPLLITYGVMEKYQTMTHYLGSISYVEALFIMVIVVIIGSRPIITFSEKILEHFARIGGDTGASWWWTILTIGPILAILLKEPGALALCAILLGKKFFQYNRSKHFAYMTLALCLANVSVAGTLTSFSSRSLLLLTSRLEWSTLELLTRFGWKAIISILCSNTLIYFLFRKEFKTFPKKILALEKEEKKIVIPYWVTICHLIFLTLVVILHDHPILFIGVLLLFLAFYQATIFYQESLHLRSALLVGFFFASLLIHGELQGWWIAPLLQNLSDSALIVTSFFLSAFVDNAIVTYFSVEIFHPDAIEHYFVVSGAMAAGGLTIIASATNPIVFSILRSRFAKSISFVRVFFFALVPSLISLFFFWVLRAF